MDKQYSHAKSGFNQFNCRNLGNCNDLYLASDVLLLMEQANGHAAAFFEDRPIFVFSVNLGYSLLKNAQHPNLWPPHGGIWSNFIIFTFMGKYSSQG